MPRPSKSWIALPALLVAAFVAGRHSLAQEAPAKSVKALRYTILWGESALDLAHDGGQLVQEIFFPEKKVACTLTFQWREGDTKPVPRLSAYPADRPRNDLTGIGNPPSRIEAVEVPAAVAEEIYRLAELTRRQQRETWRLGREVVRQGLMKKLAGARGPESK